MNEIVRKQEELNYKFEALKETVDIFHQTIEKNIDWFYAALAIILTVLIVGLIFLVRTSVSIGIEKGIAKTHKKLELLIKESQPLRQASGNNVVSPTHTDLLQVHGLLEINKLNFIALTVVNKDGRVFEYKDLEIMDGGFSVRIVDYNPKTDGGLLYWSIVWRNDVYFSEKDKTKAK